MNNHEYLQSISFKEGWWTEFQEHNLVFSSREDYVFIRPFLSTVGNLRFEIPRVFTIFIFSIFKCRVDPLIRPNSRWLFLWLPEIVTDGTGQSRKLRISDFAWLTPLVILSWANKVFLVIVACLVAMIVIHFNLWHESSSPLFLPGLFVNVLAALLASGGAALTLKETINQIPVLVLNGVAATSLLLSFMGVIR